MRRKAKGERGKRATFRWAPKDGIAAEQLKRICYGLEIDPKYVDMVVRRWQKLRGKEAILEADGRGFEQVRTERCGGTKDPAEASDHQSAGDPWLPEGVGNEKLQDVRHR